MGSRLKLGKSSSGAKDVRKREALQEYWAFRFTEDTIGIVGSWDQLFEKLKSKYFRGRFQLEKGDGGVVHYQGVLHCKPRQRRSQMHEWLASEWPLQFPVMDYCEKSESAAADRYAMKEDTRIDGPWEWNMPREPISVEIEVDDIIKYEELPVWSQDLIDMVKGRLPDKTDRTIYWFWSEKGEMYKTETARYLSYWHDGVPVQGGRKHVLAVAYKYKAPIYMLLVPRTDEGFVSYASIELIKDALYMSAFGTEATGPVNRKKPWVIVMANFPPDEGALSKGRISVTNVDM